MCCIGTGEMYLNSEAVDPADSMVFLGITIYANYIGDLSLRDWRIAQQLKKSDC